jgi:hypothetical protein
VSPAAARVDSRRHRAYDFYSIDLQAGTATIKVDNVPANLAARVDVIKPPALTYFFTSRSASPNLKPGESLSLSVPVSSTGPYLVRVSSVDLLDFYFPTNNGELPDHYTKPYRLVVTQP